MGIRSTVSLAPIYAYDSPIGRAVFPRIQKFVTNRRETMAWSIDDALTIVNAGIRGSKIRVWNAGSRPDHEIKQLIENAPEIEWWNSPGGYPFVVDVQDQLTEHESLEYRTRELHEIHYLTIHHSVSWLDYETNLENAQRMARYHVNTRGWPGIGYHFIIAPDGQILQCHDLGVVSYHAGSFAAPGDENVSAIGICLGGDFRNHRPSGPQIWAARSLCDALKAELTSSISVTPHKRMPGAATQCPGEYQVEKWLREVSGQDDVF